MYIEYERGHSNQISCILSISSTFLSHPQVRSFVHYLGGQCVIVIESSVMLKLN